MTAFPAGSSPAGSSSSLLVARSLPGRCSPAISLPMSSYFRLLLMMMIAPSINRFIAIPVTAMVGVVSLANSARVANIPSPMPAAKLAISVMTSSFFSLIFSLIMIFWL